MVSGVLNDLTLKQVHCTDELGHHPAGRAFINIHRRANLLNPAIRHDRYTVGHGHGLFLVVGHHDAGHTHLLNDLNHFQLHFGAQLFIQRAHGLIKQQQLGPFGKRARQGDPLALTARKLVGFTLSEALHMHQFEHLGNPRFNFSFRQLVLL